MKTLLIYALTVHLAQTFDCIDGEKWFEHCKLCSCKKNNKFSCSPSGCVDEKCIPGSIWFNATHRCNCGVENKPAQVLCVRLKYQQDLVNKPCEMYSYFYDSYTWCGCDALRNKTVCQEVRKGSGGACKPGSITFENCHTCSCTHTRFRICRLDLNCFHGKSK